MKSRSAITMVLLLFVAASIVYLMVWSGPETPSDEDPAPAAAAVDQPEVIAYYFHGNKRCPTCLKIEEYAATAVRTGFPNEIDRGKLVWRVVNYEEPGNVHFVEDYDLYAASLILVDARAEAGPGMWSNLDSVWALVGDEETFTAYVQRNVRAYLEGS